MLFSMLLWNWLSCVPSQAPGIRNVVCFTSAMHEKNGASSSELL